MLRKITAPVFTIVIVALFLLSFSSSSANGLRKAPQPLAATPKPDCSKTTDADIVKAIKEQLQADPDIAPEMIHLNVSVKKKKVKLEGWLSDEKLISKAVAIAKKSPCVKKVISTVKEQAGGISCGPGLKPCGGACIDKASACNIGN